MNAQSIRAIPDDNLALPVSITLKTGGSGSGFYLRGKKFIYLVTAKHVLFDLRTEILTADSADIVSYQKDPAIFSPTTFSIDLKALHVSGKIKHKGRDIVAVQIGEYKHLSKDDNPISFFHEITSKDKYLNIVAAELSGLTKFEGVAITEDVFISGYPKSIGIGHNQFDYERPLFRRGVVAGLNYPNKSIILDCIVYPGNSGGPVIQVENLADGSRKITVIGIVIQLIPFSGSWINNQFVHSDTSFTNSGYSVAESIDSVLDLLGDDA